jgi:hypothetical protein
MITFEAPEVLLAALGGESLLESGFDAEQADSEFATEDSAGKEVSVR